MIINRSAQEMALQIMPPSEYNIMKDLFPTPRDLDSWGTPEQVWRALQAHPRAFTVIGDGKPEHWKQNKRLPFYKFFGRFGTYVDTYQYVYDNALKPIRDMQKLDTLGKIHYLADHQIEYRTNKADQLMASGFEINNFLDSVEKGLTPTPESINGYKQYIQITMSNLAEYIYLSSFPGYGYLRENLLEAYRAIREELRASNIADVALKNVRRLPQRPRTSRNLGENETQLGLINAGYRFVEDEYVNYEGTAQVLQLVTWFFSDAGQNIHLYADYYDVGFGSEEKALAKARTSPIYKAYVEQYSPRDYALYCSIFEIDEPDPYGLIDSLTLFDNNSSKK